MAILAVVLLKTLTQIIHLAGLGDGGLAISHELEFWQLSKEVKIKLIKLKF